MITVGLIGEDPYDKQSIKNLLSKKYQEVNFKPILKSITGGGLDSPKTARAITQELKHGKFNFILFIRDLDGFPTQNHLLEKINAWFDKLKINELDILLLNVWELESLIFADIETFNRKYGTKIKFTGNPTMVDNPKEKLKEQTFRLRSKYQESDCPIIFNSLNIDLVEKNCSSFSAFLQKFDLALKGKTI